MRHDATQRDLSVLGTHLTYHILGDARFVAAFRRRPECGLWACHPWAQVAFFQADVCIFVFLRFSPLPIAFVYTTATSGRPHGSTRRGVHIRGKTLKP